MTHARELADWTGTTFAAFGIDETEDEVRYRRAACLLADIGWRAHPEYRGTQALNIIAHASFIGVDHPGRAFIALANLYRHEGIFDESRRRGGLKALAPPRYVERARVLAAPCCASSTCFRRRCRASSRSCDGKAAAIDRLALVIPARSRGLYGERPVGRLAQVAKITGRKLDLVIDGGETANQLAAGYLRRESSE